LLTLTGAGGVGKTRLALEAAGGAQDQYHDGVWLVELAPLADGALVPAAVARLLGQPEQAGRSNTDRLIGGLADQRLVLPNWSMRCCGAAPT
jgi:predicted ATPase